jgi:urea transport system substrate-binding protein
VESLRGEDTRVTNDPMEAHYIGFNMWVHAVEAAGTTDVDAVRDRDVRPEVPNLTGGTGRDAAEPPPDQAGADRRDPDDGQFDIISQTEPKCRATPGPTSCRNRPC